MWWVHFDPAVGSEIRKFRPAVVVSNNRANVAAPRIQVVPLTTNATEAHAWEAPIRIGGRVSKALADQIRTIDKSRLGNRIGSVTPQEMRDVERAIRKQLALE